MSPGEQVLVHRVYAVCAGLTAVFCIAFGAMADIGPLSRLSLVGAGILLLVYVFRAARFKPPTHEPPVSPSGPTPDTKAESN